MLGRDDNPRLHVRIASKAKLKGNIKYNRFHARKGVTCAPVVQIAGRTLWFCQISDMDIKDRAGFAVLCNVLRSSKVNDNANGGGKLKRHVKVERVKETGTWAGAWQMVECGEMWRGFVQGHLYLSYFQSLLDVG
jgi:hypothetical protein